jgi:hypothetical protein
MGGQAPLPPHSIQLCCPGQDDRMKLPPALNGQRLTVKKREIEFSFHPMVRTNRRWGLHSTLYAADPWAVILGSISPTLASANAAKSFVRQAREYFHAAATSSSVETQPLLYYYAFLNLGKAISIARGRQGLVGKVHHGMAVVGGTAHTPQSAQLDVQGSRSTASAVDELHWALEGRGIAAGNYPISQVISQSVIAHRMWREASSQLRKERFITVDQVHFMQSPGSAAKEVWARLYLRRDTLRARGRGLQETIRDSTLGTDFQAVLNPNSQVSAEFHTIEQGKPAVYTGRPSDVVMDVVGTLRTRLWETITSNPPYRNFYLYLSPPGEKRMPQWLSIYSIFFWLGSLTRYQPVELQTILNGAYGPFFREFLETQPNQLLYILASDIKKQNVTRPAVV